MLKQCITRKEFNLILDNLRKETDVISDGTDYCYEGTCSSKKSFYWIICNQFETFPMFIGKLHETYGRNIDVRVAYSQRKDNSNLISVSIRGYEKELR